MAEDVKAILPDDTFDFRLIHRFVEMLSQNVLVSGSAIPAAEDIIRFTGESRLPPMGNE
jgi:hypothetical protein